MPSYHETGFVHRVAAWHRGSTVLAEAPTSWPEARTAGGIDWDVEERQSAFITDIRPAGRDDVIELADGRFVVPTMGEKAIVRNDTGAHLGTVGEGFVPVLNAQMGELLEAFVGQDGGAKYDTAGSAEGGKIVYATVVLDEPFRIIGDESDTYTMACILNGHDGNLSARCQPTNVRVVCANTAKMSAALGDRTGLQTVFNHTANIREKLEQVKGALANMRAEGLRYREVCNQLAVMEISDDKIQEAIEIFVDVPAPGKAGERARNNALTAVATIKGYLTETDPRKATTSEAHRNTAYGLFNAMTEYLDHGREIRSQDAYLRRTLLTSDKGKAKALRLVTKAAGRDLVLA
jgi:phage/plasmid-like protein (TIGR03299 family)